MSVHVPPDGRVLYLDGKPSFLLIDTVWSAFTHAQPDEWDGYLAARAVQGFNAIQVSLLPILDDTPAPGLDRVFNSTGGTFGDDLAEDYLARARQLISQARARNMTPLLILLWCNYVPGSGAAQDPGGRRITLDEVDGYITRVVETFAEFDPIYVASGDADFTDPDAVAIFVEAARAVRRHAPRALLATHPAADRPIVPAALDEQLDIVMYQSGHDPATQQWTYQHAETLLAAGGRRRPLINAEPCYEGIGYAFRYGRFLAADVRRAMWSSVLAGATAGLGYGAHGVWQWYRTGETYRGAHFASMPFDVHTALQFPGAADAGFLRGIVEQFQLTDLGPRQDLLGAIPAHPDPRQRRPPLDTSVRVAATPDQTTVAVYLPYAAEVRLDGIDLRSHCIRALNLTARAWVDVTPNVDSGAATFALPDAPGDWLYLCTAH